MAIEGLKVAIIGEDKLTGVLNNAQKSVEDLQKKVKGASIAAGIAFATISAGAIKVTKDFADTGEKIYNFSKATGVSAESASVMKMAADEMGLSLEAVGSAVKKMQVNLEKIDDAKLQELGMNLDSIVELKPEEQFFKLGNAIASIQDPAQRTTAAIDYFGKAGTELIPLFNEGASSLEEFKKKAEEAGVMFDELSLNKAVALDNAFDNLSTSMNGAKQQIAIGLSPAIAELVDKHITPAIEKITEWVKKNPELTLKIIEITLAVTGLIAVLYPLLTVVGLVTGALAFMAANPIVVLLGVLALLAAAIYLLVTNWEAVHAWLETNFPTMTKIIDVGIGAAKSMINSMIDTIGLAVAAFETLFSAITRFDSAYMNFGQQVGNMALNAVNYATGNTKRYTTVNGKTTYKAEGGAVSAGQPYIVGEKRPELFVPSTNGYIHPTVPNGGVTINFKGVFGSDAAHEIGDLIIKRLVLNKAV